LTSVVLKCYICDMITLKNNSNMMKEVMELWKK
jgi:hypothetical protein